MIIFNLNILNINLSFKGGQCRKRRVGVIYESL